LDASAARQLSSEKPILLHYSRRAPLQVTHP
jgi:hypothetical protein